MLCAGVAIGLCRAAPLWSEIPAAAQPLKTQIVPDFSDLAARLSPTVVNISCEQSERGAAWKPESETDPFNQLPRSFEHFEPHRPKGLGSGFIINPDGYILTNDHVIEDTSRVTVSVQDGHQFKAKVIGRDSKTDIALLKIDAAERLPYAPLGDSDSVRVGQWVMAIGNPFGFDHSVTAGIVSAKGRFIPGNYDEFIQTDASINPGNSGGPLFNLNGEVVAVNSAIYTRTGSSVGIGFAIPVNLVKQELGQLKNNGRVTHGWLGVYVQKVTPDLARTMKLDSPRGALVAQVLKEGPARLAGIERGDVIVEFDHKAIADSRQLPMVVGSTPVGRTVTVEIVRDGTPKYLKVTITPSREEELAKAEAQAQPKAESARATGFGLRIRDLTPQIASELGLAHQRGVLVDEVLPDSAASQAGLRKHDVILEVDRRAVADISSYNEMMQGASKEKVVLFLVRRGNETVFVPLRPAG